jgi:hypothetical protein
VTKAYIMKKGEIEGERREAGVQNIKNIIMCSSFEEITEPGTSVEDDSFVCISLFIAKVTTHSTFTFDLSNF